MHLIFSSVFYSAYSAKVSVVTILLKPRWAWFCKTQNEFIFLCTTNELCIHLLVIWIAFVKCIALELLNLTLMSETKLEKDFAPAKVYIKIGELMMSRRQRLSFESRWTFDGLMGTRILYTYLKHHGSLCKFRQEHMTINFSNLWNWR